VFLAVAAVMATIGDGVARTFRLLVFVALLYGLAFLTGWRHLGVATSTTARTPQPVARP
jgi:hypothetical protein